MGRVNVQRVRWRDQSNLLDIVQVAEEARTWEELDVLVPVILNQRKIEKFADTDKGPTYIHLKK